jgi:diguanylate cyclase (GGDEF)-like protein
MKVRQPFRRQPEQPARGLSIRARLMLLALLAVVPLTLDRVRILENSRAERLETARAEAIDLSRRVVESQSEIINSTRAVLQVATRLYESTVDHDCTALSSIVTKVPWLTSLSVVGSNDRVVCSAHATMMGRDLSDRPYLLKARETGDFVLSDYVIDSGNGAPAVIAAQLVRGDDATGATVLAAPIDLGWQGRAQTNIARRPGTSVLLVDGRGQVIAALPDQAGLTGRNFADHPAWARMLAQQEGQTVLDWLDGRRRIVAFARLPGTESNVLVALDERELLSRIDREIGIAYLQLVMFGLLVLLAAWFGGEQLIVHPIRALAQVATRIGRGELDARPTGQKWAAEFAPLVTALADMGSRLSERERELRSVNRHLETLASIDGLSGLANRRSFDAHLDAEWQRALLSGRSLGLMMIDVDHFKLFNDNYGHVEGDHCLQMIGDLINAASEGGDFAARYGGEEFALLMPNTTVLHAMHLAEALRGEVAALAITHSAVPEGIITISIGVACRVPSAGELPQSLVEAADAGLYQAKRCGRNRVATEAPDLVPVAG